MSFLEQVQHLSRQSQLNRRQALIGVSLLALAACSRSAPSAASPNRNVSYYTCPMHPSVHSQDPNGNCPLCGMNLVPVTQSPSTAHLDPSKLQEVGATTETVTRRTVGGITSLMVSTKAVLPTGNSFLVFIDRGQGNIEPRQVQVGNPSGDGYPVISGLKERDQVFSGGLFLLDAECRAQGVQPTTGDRP